VLESCPFDSNAQDLSQSPRDHLVTIRVSAFDKSGSPLIVLRKEHLRLFEDGVQQEILTMVEQPPTPLSVAFLIDNSISMSRSRPLVKSISSRLIDSVIRPGEDVGSVISFTSRPKVEQDFTDSPVKMREAIDRIEDSRKQAAPPTTSIYDSLWFVCQEALNRTSDKSRRAVIVVSDCEETSSTKTPKDVGRQAIQSSVAIYAICFGGTFARSRGGVLRSDGRSALRELSTMSGGRVFIPTDHSDLISGIRRINHQLRTQYAITFRSTSKKGPGFRKVMLEVASPELRSLGVELEYQHGYVRSN
jgi:Ca-activated chloride channel family protein